jgi:hypothetical protein
VGLNHVDGGRRAGLPPAPANPPKRRGSSGDSEAQTLGLKQVEYSVTPCMGHARRMLCFCIMTDVCLCALHFVGVVVQCLMLWRVHRASHRISTHARHRHTPHDQEATHITHSASASMRRSARAFQISHLTASSMPMLPPMALFGS